MLDRLPWYKSRIMIGAFVSILSKILVLSGVLGEFTEGDQQALVDIIVLLGGGIGDVLVLYGRVTQKTAPTITATRADTTPLLSLFAILACSALLMGCAAVPLGDLQLKRVGVTSVRLCEAIDHTNSGTATPPDFQYLAFFDAARLALQQHFEKFFGYEAEVSAECK